MSKRIIKRVAVLGSGVMGSRIACHFAGAGIPVLMLDMETKQAADALAAAVRSNPSPIYSQSSLRLITTGNFNDNLAQVKDCDWIIEVVVERLDVKKSLFEKVDALRKPGTLITSNTSGIPIRMMAEGRSDDFRKHFCGTHFFNPPRYLRLLEIIPGPDTNKEVIEFLQNFGDIQLGKTTVLCKDTPAFIANRIGVFGIMSIFKLLDELDLNIDELDMLTGPIIGRPKSATFRTADVVGIDTLANVAKGVYENCPTDDSRNTFIVPEWLKKMVENKWLGDKSGQGFFKKTKNEKGETEILTLDLKTQTYLPRKKAKFATTETAKPVEDLKQRLRMLVQGGDKAAEFYRKFHYGLFSYISHRIPEITDDLYRLDDAMMAGFGWEIGAFESWDVLGVKQTVEAMDKAGYAVAPWVQQMLGKGIHSFYKIEKGRKLYYSITTGNYEAVPGGNAYIVMKNFEDATLWKNNSCRLYHLGDDVLGLEWYTKMGSIGSDVLEGIQKSITLSEESYKGLVIANEGANFSAGANVGMIFMFAVEQDFDEMDMAIRLFQKTMMRVRYSAIPVVAAPHGLSLGGGSELILHSDKACPAAETYAGLVEAGIGVIPGGGGTKEFVLRSADEMHDGEPETVTLKNRFLTIATAKVSTSAAEGFDLGIFRRGHDEIVMNQSRRIAEAKKSVIELFDSGYQLPVQRTDIKVLGRTALGALYAGIHGMWRAGYATDHDVVVAKKLAYVMCGGDLSEPTLVSEQYLLDLEREAFLSLAGERKTLERIQSVIKTGRPVRN
jgi:3-hydroxyacyl-CoA dehydrogenase